MIRFNKILPSAAMACLLPLATQSLASGPVDLDTKDVRAGGTPVGDLFRGPFERTASTDNVFHFSGLANVYANVEAHGGHIFVEPSTLGGARFTICLSGS